ncbi:hypothetical protein DL769_010476 [Monosporascus sp. CRB-8-3]|nr:hypothetical protein DL769_010476 [Monosporascus sp. CRB-8-3]
MTRRPASRPAYPASQTPRPRLSAIRKRLPPQAEDWSIYGLPILSRLEAGGGQTPGTFFCTSEPSSNPDPAPYQDWRSRLTETPSRNRTFNLAITRPLLRDLRAADPLFDPGTTDLSQLAITDADAHLCQFHDGLAEDVMESCNRCRHRRFAMDLKEGVCSQCRYHDRDSASPLFFSAGNNLAWGVVPPGLQELT